MEEQLFTFFDLMPAHKPLTNCSAKSLFQQWIILAARHKRMGFSLGPSLVSSSKASISLVDGGVL
jgi:hypothetical protein